jgi:hypothetical protein
MSLLRRRRIPCGLMARKINNPLEAGTGRARNTRTDLYELAGAGDENRTRTISLGSSAVTAARGADQASLAVLSDRG